MRYTGPKARLCRREKQNLFSSPKYAKIMAKRSPRLGMHGDKRPGKMSEFARQLREKQKGRYMYGLSEKQFKKYYSQATRMHGVTGEEMFKLMERRLDNAIFRAGLAMTRMQSRQFASHGLFTVNGRRVDVPSYQLREGDVVEVRQAKKDSPIFRQIREELENYTPPSWLQVDTRKLSFTVTALPDADHIDTVIDNQLIVEFYSR
ncbi:30S ribosomal protein S4 [Candidatus Peribacteria bacterium]|nr:30S ribosomal protein S4 [Candidatus Peribacteria bacterium]